MADIKVDGTVLSSLHDKVVVVTGCAQGIGAETARQLFQAGALLVASDLNDAKGQGVVDELNRNKGKQRDAAFVQVDVSSYESIHGLFRRALDIHGRVDMAIHCAAITEIGGWFTPGVNLDAIARPPTTKVLDVNLIGTLYFTHIALAAMRPDSNSQGTDKSITLISSVAGFKEAPGLFTYSTSKHGVMGLMRSLRGFLPSAFNVRINVICPWATATDMLGSVGDLWAKNSLPVNTPEDVARITLQCAGDEKIHGRAVYVADGKGFDIEEGIDQTEPEWLGEKQSRDLARGQEIIGTGFSWGTKKD
ncbi:hypothetical protein ACJ41O_001461 [Fusarium nematophilum]